MVDNCNMNTEYSWKNTYRKNQIIKKKLSQFYHAHHKSHMDCPKIDRVLHGERLVTNHLRYAESYISTKVSKFIL